MKSYSKTLIIFYIFSATLSAKLAATTDATTDAKYQNFLGKRHIILLQGDLENLYGSYFFGVQNQSNETKKLRFPLVLPKGTTDFEPQSGITKEEIIVSESGELAIESSFKSGLSLIEIRFKIPLQSNSKVILHWQSPFNLDEFSVATPLNSGLHLKSENLHEGTPHMLGQDHYTGLMTTNVLKGTTIEVFIDGFPKGRKSLWILGITFFILLNSILCWYVLKDLKIKNKG